MSGGLIGWEDKETSLAGWTGSKEGFFTKKGKGNLNSLKRTSYDIKVQPLGDKHLLPLWVVE